MSASACFDSGLLTKSSDTSRAPMYWPTRAIAAISATAHTATVSQGRRALASASRWVIGLRLIMHLICRGLGRSRALR